MRNKRVCKHLLAIGILALSVTSCSERVDVVIDSSISWDGDFKFGPFAVGFRTALLERPGPEGPREIALSVWYPAEAGNEATRAMQIADYFGSTLEEGQLTETVGLDEEAAFVAAMTGDSTALSPDRARSGLDAPVAALIEAPSAKGVYPVVLWSTRHATVMAQAPLAEVLASHGFVVATAWSSAPPLAFLWEDRSAADKEATILAHTNDLALALEELRRDALVDGDNVVLLAWSYGGQTAARLQEREPAIRGVVALDANVVPARPEESLELKHPLIYMVGRDTSRRGFERLEYLTAPWVALRFPELAHGNFNALEGYLPAALGADTVYSWSRGGRVAQDGYRSLTQIVTSAVRTLSSGSTPTVERIMTNLRAAAESTIIEMSSSDPNRDY